jgi:hypothetical protein
VTRPTDHGGQAGGLSEPVRRSDVVTQISGAVQLEDGHPLRGARCLYCGRHAGAGLLVTAVIIDMRHSACDCGALAVTCYVIHAEHETGPKAKLIDLALGTFASHHGGAVRL